MTDPTTREGRDALRALAAEAFLGRGVVACESLVGGARRAVICDPATAAYFEAIPPHVLMATLDHIDSLEADRARFVAARAAWSAFDPPLAHHFRCDAPRDAEFTDPRCDCGLRALSEALS